MVQQTQVVHGVSTHMLLVKINLPFFFLQGDCKIVEVSSVIILILEGRLVGRIGFPVEGSCFIEEGIIKLKEDKIF